MDYSGILNYIILQGKWFIFKQKLCKKTPLFSCFLNGLKYTIEIERTIACNRNEMQNFNVNFGILADGLQKHLS